MNYKFILKLIHFSYNDYNYYSIYFLFCVSNGVG
nr:MAG TPA: hypothetical protein [Caudoviricetes sp.]